MSENTSLVLLSRADLALEEADTIYKLKELRNLALTAADWLKRKNASESIIQKARTLALEAERKMGQMLIEASEKGEREIRGGDRKSKFPDGTLIKPTLADLGLTKRESSEAQMLADLPVAEFESIKTGKKTISKAKAEKNIEVRRERHIAETKAALSERPVIIKGDCLDVLKTVPPIDLLLTDPPYFTDGDFTGHVSKCLARVKPTGQAYIFASADPAEIAAYLGMDSHGLTLEQVLIWNYNNTGQRQPNKRYTSNYQIIFYYRGPEAPAINKPSDGTHQYACQNVNAPDGRIGDRFHEWQKPMELVERLIRNSSRPGDFIFDSFAGSGTIILAAAKLGRKVIGCDNDPNAIKICLERGCVREP